MNDWRREAFDKATTAAHVALNFRQEDIDVVAQALFEDNERGLFFSHCDPRRIFVEIHRRLVLARAKEDVVVKAEPKRRPFEIRRHGASNVIRVGFKPIDRSGFAYCFVADAGMIRDLLSEEKQAQKRRLVSVPPANDEAPPYEPPRWSMRFKMSRQMLERARRQPRIVNSLRVTESEAQHLSKERATARRLAALLEGEAAK